MKSLGKCTQFSRAIHTHTKALVKHVLKKKNLERRCKTFPRKAKFSFESCVKNSRKAAKTRSFFVCG